METTSVEPQVKIISTETVKPFTPTPSHLRTFNLSMLDQISAPLHVSALLFYNAATQTQAVDITALKTALSETLSHFYPLAGRCKDESTIICNDEGVTFIEAHVDCSLSDVLGSCRKLDLLGKFQFFPPKDLLATGKQHVSELVQLAFQVNVFVCGGVVIGCYMLHKVLDGTSLGLFFKHWSAIARNSYDDVIQPDFDSTVAAFPPYHSEQQEKAPTVIPDDSYYAPNDDNLKIVGKGFVFSDVAVSKLKAKAASKQVPNPTRFEAVLGFIWEQALAAESAVSAHAEPPVLLFAADIRKRVGPPLSERSIGNLVANPIAFAETGFSLPELVAEIHVAIQKVTEEVSRDFQGDGQAEAILAHRSKLGGYLVGYRPSTYMVSSWCRNGLSEADFGFGRPRWVVFPVTDGIVIPPCRNFISLTDYTDSAGDGTVAWIYLEEKEMRVLESNQEFLGFASQW
ncbi:hypothetical protein RND81_14G096700 [Saponaria officinalis]|uniref:Uncharacterized protein n=1 Tax=Saponaria officinalis TaxID=3572 RepID=A0AAW1GUD5_SAPOF